MRIGKEQLIAAAIAIAMAGGLLGAAFAIQPPTPVAPTRLIGQPSPAVTALAVEADKANASVVFAGGCFWGIQGVFQHLRGVTRAESGYAGGAAATATYTAVSSGTTGHAESVRVDYDPTQISYAQLMRVFFSVAHDPTQLNRQGPDHGTQYRSAVFASSPVQARATRAYIADLERTGDIPGHIVTEVKTDVSFHPAERYHQNYLANNPRSPYIRAWDQPKIEALKQQFSTLYREQPVLLQTSR